MKLSRRIMDLVPSSIAVLDRDGVILAVNEPWRRFAMENNPQSGAQAPYTAIGVNYLDICHEAGAGSLSDEGGKVCEGIRAVIEGRLPGFRLEYACHSPTKQRWVAMTASPLPGEMDKVVIIHTEVTDRERSDQQARASEQLFRSLFEASLDAVLLVTPDGGVLAANSAAQTMFGFSDAELRSRGWYGLLDTGDPRITAGAKQYHADGQFSGEVTCIDKTGRRFPVEVASSAFAGKDGERITSFIVRDVSKRVQFEAQLIASRKRYLALFRDATDAVAIAAADGKLEEVNARFAALLGYAGDELRGLSVDQIHPAEELPRIRNHFARIFRDGSSESLEAQVLCKDGRRVEVEIRPTLIELGDHYVAQGVFIDLTERKRQELLRIEQERQQRNTLVREVHHRIKNNLQSVSGLLQRELGKFMELNPRLQTAIGQVNAIAVVHGLQCDNPDEAIRLCDSVRKICQTVAELALRPVHFTIENEQTTFRQTQIASDEAVSVALVLNELILNAVKHSPPEGPAPTVSLSADGRNASIVICNAVLGAPGFDIATRQGLGTGLHLVRSLLPAQGADLAYEVNQQRLILTRLTLAPPVVVEWNPQTDTACA
ncbi:MAG: PAS domain S-box protein [Sulfuritalea sp.]|nr:PAS domain S-box protein [Sulfuritalea sp.]